MVNPIEKIKESPVIVIYRHVNPDMDALGSQMGLKKAIESIWPDKKVYAAGNMSAKGFVMDKVDDETAKNALAVILDTANSARIDDDRWKLAKDSIRIDHHVPVETIAKTELLNQKASATCEMVALLLDEAGYDISKEAAQYLYQGLTADNIRFSIGSVSPDSFKAGGYLIGQGADPVAAELANFGSSYREFKYKTEVAKKANFENGVLYSVMETEDYLRCGLSFGQAKEFVYAMQGITDVEVWILFTKMEDDIHYSCSLRSRNYPVRLIAAKYGGGGHDLASGIKDLTSSQVYEIIQECIKLVS